MSTHTVLLLHYLYEEGEARKMIRLGVDSFIWTDNFSEKDLWIIPKAKEMGFETIDIYIADVDTFPTDLVKKEVQKADIEVVTTHGLPEDANTISPDPEIRARGKTLLKKLIDLNISLGSKIAAGISYTAWGYRSGKPRTEQEWEWSVTALREAAEYAKERDDLIIAVEVVNRFETHFLNIAADAVQYCKDVGTGNVKVHLDTFHMIREEDSFTGAVETCGKEYLGYVHACESQRGIPGTGLVPWKDFFSALKNIEYDGPVVIESFDPSFEEINRLCSIWRKLADSGEELAEKGLAFLQGVLSTSEKT
jgi:D-psicose/D-tagatose/L-ribulose 3-epimerase